MTPFRNCETFWGKIIFLMTAHMSLVDNFHICLLRTVWRSWTVHDTCRIISRLRIFFCCHYTLLQGIRNIFLQNNSAFGGFCPQNIMSLGFFMDTPCSLILFNNGLFVYSRLKGPDLCASLGTATP